MKLTASIIVAAGLNLVNDEGFDAFTTRKLAAALAIKGPSLYHHFSSREHLLDAMAIELMRRFIFDVPLNEGWEAFLRNFAIRGRNMALSVRDGARILTASVPRNAEREAVATKYAMYLMKEGFTHDAAFRALGTISSFSSGWSMHEQARREWLLSVMDVEHTFRLSIESIIAGLRLDFVARAAE